MFSLRAGDRPASVFKAPAQIAVLVVAILVSGCSSTGPVAQNANWHASDMSGSFAGLLPRPPVEIEDDGREAQLPPRKRDNLQPDDPTEPFSPNYGSVRPASVPSQWVVTVVRERA